MKILLLCFLFVPCFLLAQSTKIITDSANNHGLILSDKFYKTVPSRVSIVSDSITKSSDGWRMPSDSDMQEVFNKTWSKRLFASTYTTNNCIDSSGNVVYMTGRKFQMGLPYGTPSGDEMYFTYFLVKPF